MRYFAFLLLTCSFIMCKSKQVLPADQLLHYVVIMEGNSSAKELKNDISHKMVEYRKVNVPENQWALDFVNNSAKEDKLKFELLNHPSVVTVFTLAEYEKMIKEKESKSKAGSYGSKPVLKQ